MTNFSGPISAAAIDDNDFVTARRPRPLDRARYDGRFIDDRDDNGNRSHGLFSI